MDKNTKAIVKERILAKGLSRYQILGFVADINQSEISDALHAANIYEWFVNWLCNQTAEVKGQFIDDLEFDNLRLCDNCGKFMVEGYYLSGNYACSRECAVGIYKRDGFTEEDLDIDLEAEEQFNNGECYYTEWE